MTARQRRRVALTTAGVVAAVGMAFAPHPVHPPAQAVTTATSNMPVQAPTNLPPLLTHYGAIAYSHDGAFGMARRHKSKLGAQQQAMERCGGGTCTVVTTFTKCGAVAHDGATYHGGVGLSRTAAETHAMSHLGGGQIVLSVCN
ncbi:DUF4189 domain-containing protein [Mycobacterium sp. 1423905.2]|uniref:DUF4189 domain-containing protein n=1 Tax=Mycobacterium sp. 1423905.2 TaxID=1856859 RepID=UPI0007FCE0D9|nr:DUF4189 domain-containing protein [Mycobacterium sp. 1423905.2]OBJ60428.1 hypothetical protein A9W95_10305 [Mycobacterium sp. 1423905.2]